MPRLPPSLVLPEVDVGVALEAAVVDPGGAVVLVPGGEAEAVAWDVEAIFMAVVPVEVEADAPSVEVPEGPTTTVTMLCHPPFPPFQP